jgi:hypothetical protein
VTSFSEEANCQCSQLKLAKPGSEYANTTSGSYPQPGSDAKTNPANSVRIHKYNPKGVPCENPVCVGLPHSLTHDKEHCLQPGGGAEGTKGSWGRKGSKAKKDITASAAESKLEPQQPPPPEPKTPSQRQ